MHSTRSFRKLLVALLCLWLPLQAAAGLWLPCHELDEMSKPIAQESSAQQGCHGHQQDDPSVIDAALDKAPHDERCDHCQVSCHFSSLVLLSTPLQPPIISLPDYLKTPGPSLESTFLDSLQRPPRHA